MASVIRGSGASTLGGNVDVQGVLTYEDVTSVDSVGIVTANAGIDISNTIVSNNDSTIRYDDTDFVINVDSNNVRGSSKFKINVDTVNAITIDDNRRVGIGSEIPTAALDVLSTAYPTVEITRDHDINYPRLRIVNAATDGADLDGLGDGTGGFRISCVAAGVSTERLRINSKGQMILGTASNLGTVPPKLTIVNNTNSSTFSECQLLRLNGPSGVGERGGIGFHYAQSSDYGEKPSSFIGVETVAVGGAQQTDLLFATRPNTADNEPTERLRITSAGLVGIGTTNPSTLLHLLGEDSYFTMQSSSASGNAGILFKDSSGTQNGVIFYDFDNDFLKFSTNNDAEALRISSSGEVTKPLQPLAIIGTSENNWSPTAGDVMPFNYSNTNRGNHYNTSNYTFTCPVAGDYMVILRLSRKGFCGDLELAKNNSQYALLELRETGRDNSSAANWQAWCYDFIIPCAVNDTLKWKVSQIFTGTGSGNYLLDGSNHIYYDSVTYYLLG